MAYRGIAWQREGILERARFFGSPPPPPPPPAPAPVQIVEDKSAEKAAADKEKLAASKRKGRASTMITGGEGVTEAAPTALATLLGA